jgi:WD40 repeat protein
MVAEAIVIELKGHSGLVVALAYSPDGRTLASASADGTARLWDLNTGKLTATLQSPAARAYCVAFSPDGKTLAVGFGGPHGLAQIWDIDRRTRQLSWAAHSRTTRGLAFHPQELILVTGGDGDDVRLWAIGGSTVGLVSESYPALQDVSTAAITFTRDGKLFAGISSRPATVRVWESHYGRLYRSSRELSDWGYSLAFSPLAFRVVAGLQRTVAIWDPGDYRPPLIWPAHDGAVLGVAFTPDGQTLLTGGADGLVKLWDPDGELRHSFDWKIGDVGAVAFAPDGLTAAAGGYETILVWDVES